MGGRGLISNPRRNQIPNSGVEARAVVDGRAHKMHICGQGGHVAVLLFSYGGYLKTNA